MKKFNVKSFIAGVIIASVGTSVVFAAGGIKSASFNSNKVIYNGKELDLKGFQMISVVKDEEINASNYMPVRAVLEAMGYTVDWDGENNAVIIEDNVLTSNKEEDSGETSQKIDISECVRLRDFLINIGDYGCAYDVVDNKTVLVYKYAYTENKKLAFIIPQEKLIVIDGYFYLDKEYIDKELMPLIEK